MRWAAFVLLLTVSLSASAASGQPAPEVERPRQDPFARPVLEPSSRASDAREPAEIPTPVFTPVLRATLVAGANSMADLGGVVLALGQEAHGWRLVEVRRFEAVFEKDGAHVELPVEAEEVE